MSLEAMNTLTVAELESVVEAINKLQAHYRREIDLVGCPLCEVGSHLGRTYCSFAICRYCPWIWFAEVTCLGIGVNKLRIDRPQDWCDKRLSELAEWERIIRARIDELKEGRTR